MKRKRFDMRNASRDFGDDTQKQRRARAQAVSSASGMRNWSWNECNARSTAGSAVMTQEPSEVSKALAFHSLPRPF